MQIRVDIDTRPVDALLSDLRRQLTGLRPFYAEAAEILRRSVDKNFATGGRPSHWPASGRVKRTGGETLVDTGRLRRSITTRVSDRHASVGTNVVYAAIHQFGGRIGPHVIKPKRARALNIPGIGYRASVNHPGSTIPARPFLLVQDEDWQAIRAAAIRHLLKGRR